MQQISSKDEARMSTEGQDIKNAIQSPKSAVVSTGDVQNAIIDLRRLGLSFIDIYKQSGINPDFLIDAYTLVGFPVPISLRIELAAERLKAGRAGFAASSRIDQTGSSASSASHTNELLTPHLPSPHSSSNSQARFPKFGSDRWSTKFRLELSEEEDEDDSNDYDRYDEDDNYDNVRTDSSQSASNTPVISAPGRTDTHTSAKNALELKLQEIRKMTALVKELEAKKSAAEKELINSTASGSLEVVDNSRVHTMDAPQSISEHTEDLSVAHHELPLQEIAPESLNTHTKSPLQSMHTLSHIPNSANSVSEDSFKSIKDSLKQILERQDLILKQKKELKKHLENFQVRQLEKELDDLREEVERKKGKIDEITVQASLIEHRLSVTEEEENKISKILEELQNKILTTPIVKDTTRTNSHVNSVSTDNVYTERDEKQNIHDLGIISENDQNTIQLTANNMSPVEVNESSSFDEVNSLSQSAEATDLTEVDMKEGHITGNGDIEHETGNEIILSQQSNQDSNDNFALLTDHNLSNSDSPVISGQDASEMLSYGLENSIKTIGYDNATIKPEIKDQFDNTPMDITKVENSLVKRKVLDLELVREGRIE